MIKSLIKDLLKEARDPVIHHQLQEYLITPVLKYVLEYCAPYFILVTVILCSIILVLIVNLYYR